MIKRRDRVLSYGQMVANMSVLGSMESRMVLAHTQLQEVNKEWVNGKKENALHGSDISKFLLIICNFLL
jgi:hypothetical protein